MRDRECTRPPPGSRPRLMMAVASGAAKARVALLPAPSRLRTSRGRVFGLLKWTAADIEPTGLPARNHRRLPGCHGRDGVAAATVGAARRGPRPTPPCRPWKPSAKSRAGLVGREHGRTIPSAAQLTLCYAFACYPLPQRARVRANSRPRFPRLLWTRFQ